ncbi:hypothetical protein UA08_02048 [Talaromyces atroroseus]|uniref:Zn(2)-C6 fungal-type domain-containing protein n=1 Tax=Talaromyces atroroseus TaxID=1441469 RepID=A0A1Q5QAR0_TALAT|nr:hypothetical protein UA08_02048 [Talaromyces atroroseus]OKL63016.1 hypothetical protein UA08_02048 [Talaromyces atroroseus]
MTARQSTPSSEHSAHSDNVRKRVCKACDRCRLKKSKCDGASPCGRCRADNAICVFGERKKAHDKVYPKGYVEMLEQQQVWLVNGLQELYRRAQEGEGWTGEPLKAESNGHPLTHDLLTRLGALDHTKGEQFEENVESMQQKLWQQNPGYMQRQESSDGSSDTAQSPIISSSGSSNNSNNHRHHIHHHHNNNHRVHPYNVSGYAEALSRRQLPPTPPSYSPSSQTMTTIKSEQGQTPAASTNNINTGFRSTVASTSTLLLSQQGINPMALQNPQNNLHQQQQQQQSQQPWVGSNASASDLSFDDLDLLGNQYTMFDEASSSPPPMFATRQQQQQSQQQMPISCLPPSMLFDANDDFSQYFNPNMEISTI